MLKKMTQSLNSAGKTIRMCNFADGTRLLLLPYGARILGVYTDKSDENFLWTNPALEKPDTAKSIFNSDKWHNTGGDRTWLTPEVDIFFPNWPDRNPHWPPRILDASDYQLKETSAGIEMSRKMSLKFARSGRTMDLMLTKSVSQAANPLRYERDVKEKLGEVEYAGYTLSSSLELTGQALEQSDRVGLWNLLQLPHGGDMFIPTYSRTTPRVLFGGIPASDLVSDDHLVTFRIKAQGEHKIAIRAVAAAGRVGYMFESGKTWSLVIRNFSVNPSGDYVDVPAAELDDLGYCFHVVNVDSALGKFCELEYHVPAVGGSTGKKQCCDYSQFWAWRGSLQAIQNIAHTLLSKDI